MFYGYCDVIGLLGGDSLALSFSTPLLLLDSSAFFLWTFGLARAPDLPFSPVWEGLSQKDLVGKRAKGESFPPSGLSSSLLH